MSSFFSFFSEKTFIVMCLVAAAFLVAFIILHLYDYYNFGDRVFKVKVRGISINGVLFLLFIVTAALHEWLSISLGDFSTGNLSKDVIVVLWGLFFYLDRKNRFSIKEQGITYGYNFIRWSGIEEIKWERNILIISFFRGRHNDKKKTLRWRLNLSERDKEYINEYLCKRKKYSKR